MKSSAWVALSLVFFADAQAPGSAAVSSRSSSPGGPMTPVCLAGGISHASWAVSERSASRAHDWYTRYLPVSSIAAECKDSICPCGTVAQVALNVIDRKWNGLAARVSPGFGLHTVDGVNHSRSTTAGNMTVQVAPAPASIRRRVRMIRIPGTIDDLQSLTADSVWPSMQGIEDLFDQHCKSMRTYDSWMDFNVALWAPSGDLDGYINKFVVDKLAYLPLRWKYKGKEYYSVVVRIPQTQVWQLACSMRLGAREHNSKPSQP